MESNEQNKLTNKIGTDTENRLRAVRGRGVGRLGEKDEGIKQNLKRQQLIDTDTSMVITRKKRKNRGRLKRVQGG